MTTAANLLTIRCAKPGVIAEVEILVDGGPLCVAPAYLWAKDHRSPDLFRIYVKRAGLPVGPFYATISLAAAGMKKAFGIGKHFWKNDLSWFHANKWIQDWAEKELGRPNDLIGGQWVDEKGQPVKA